MKTDALIKLQVIMTERGVIDLDKRKIILDCDEGHDDAVAVLFLEENFYEEHRDYVECHR